MSARRGASPVLFVVLAAAACGPGQKGPDRASSAEAQRPTPAAAPAATESVAAAIRRYIGGECDVGEVTAGAARLSALRARLEDAEKLAGATSRIALPGPTKELQDLHREIEAVPIPGCLSRARYLLASQAAHDADAFISFMLGPEGEPAAARLRIAAATRATQFSEALDQVSKCAPSCPELAGWRPGLEPEPGEEAIPAAGLEAKAAELTTSPLLYMGASARITEANPTWARFAWQAQLRNTGPRPLTFSLTIEFVDSDGYTVDTDHENGLVIPPESDRVYTGDTLIRVPASHRVASLRAKVTT